MRLPLLILLILILVVETGLPLRAELAMIRFYRAHGSQQTAKISRCLYQPSCSAYGMHVLEKKGFWKGNAMITGRILACSPIGTLIEWMRGEPLWEPSPERKARQSK